MNIFKITCLCAAVMSVPAVASAAIVTTGPGGFNNGYATTITYDTDALRGKKDGRDNASNALGAQNGKFFEIGFGSSVDLTFGKKFNGKGTVFEVTFGNASNFPEFVDIFAGSGGNFSFVGNLANYSDGKFDLSGLNGPFDTLRLTDASPFSSSSEKDSRGRLGGFDIDAVQVSAVPVPAAGWLLMSGLGAAAALRRRKKA